MVPVECFLLFMTSALHDEILAQSNLYADQQRAAKDDQSPWTPITKEELMAFIGINIAMGIISLPTMDDYWSTDPVLSHAWFQAVFSRNRFCEILRYIHVTDNSKAIDRSAPNYDRLWKVRPLLDMLSKRSLELYGPHPQISVDESMIGTTCRLSFIQYMTKKPVKWGIKVSVCVDSVNGYIYTFHIYCGANSSQPLHPNGLGYGVVMKLLAPCLHKGYTVYMHNFYASPQLLKICSQ